MTDAEYHALMFRVRPRNGTEQVALVLAVEVAEELRAAGEPVTARAIERVLLERTPAMDEYAGWAAGEITR